MWSYAAQHGGKGNVPLGDFLKTREAIYSRNFQRAVCRSAPTRTEGCHKKSKAIILCRTGLHKGEIETGNPQGKFIWNVRINSGYRASGISAKVSNSAEVAERLWVYE